MQYSQIKVDHSLDRFKILKQLAEIIKNNPYGNKNLIKLEATLQDYDYIPRVKILTDILKSKKYKVKCEMFHDLYNVKSFFKESNYNFIIESLLDKGFDIGKNKEFNDNILKIESNVKLIRYLVGDQLDKNSLSSLYVCLSNELEIKIVTDKVNSHEGTANILSDHDAINALEIAGFQNNRHRHEETIEIIIDYYINSNKI